MGDFITNNIRRRSPGDGAKGRRGHSLIVYGIQVHVTAVYYEAGWLSMGDMQVYFFVDFFCTHIYVGRGARLSFFLILTLMNIVCDVVLVFLE